MSLLKREQPVSDSSSAMKRRDAFVAEVAETIKRRHGGEGESFVLGLSGKWGEGKSYFLGQLRTELKHRGFQVIDLNPWKYAGDRAAFLRAFLIGLLNSQSLWSRWCAGLRCLRRRRLEDAWSMFSPKTRLLASLKTDTSRQRISWLRLGVLAALILALYWVYSDVLGSQQRALIAEWRLPMTVILLPLAIWVVQGLINSQLSSKSATAVDDFDRLVSLALGGDGSRKVPGKAWQGGRRVVVLVDDLDRVTPDIARGVLDNLRTFFDKPPLSFIVTGDHSVLEASLGRELRPDKSDEQADEGRRFMKKVFNLYWRLPLPVRSDFESFVDKQMAARQAELDASIVAPADRATLRYWLLNYCEMNLRSVIRTLDMLLFTLRLVRAQRDSAPEAERPSLDQMLNRPMLLARVLMIQDRCQPLFELMVENPSLLEELDHGVAVAKESVHQVTEVDAVAGFLQTLAPRLEKAPLAPGQIEFLTSFAYEPPLFYDSASGGQVVASLGPWIHLAGDLSFKDASGPRAEDFVRDLSNLNAEAIGAAMGACSEAKATAAVEATVESLVGTDDGATRADRLLLLLRSTTSAEPERPLANASTAAIVGGLSALTAGFSDETRVAVILAVAKSIDRHLNGKIPDSADASMALHGEADLNLLPREDFGPVGSRLVMDLLLALYDENPTSCLTQMEEVLPHVGKAGLEQQRATLGEGLASDLIGDSDPARRQLRLAVLMRDIPGGSDRARTAVLGQVSVENAWTWAEQQTEDGTSISWSPLEMQDALLQWVYESADTDELLRRLMYSAGKLDARAVDLWRHLESTRPAVLDQLLERLIQEPVLAVIPVPDIVATRLYVTRVQAVVDEEDEARSIDLAGALDNGLWVWRQVARRRARDALTPIARKRARRRELQAAVRPFWERWGDDDDGAESESASE